MNKSTSICGVALFCIATVALAEPPKAVLRTPRAMPRTPKAAAARVFVPHYNATMTARRIDPTTTTTPAPGAYASVPFSSIVVVPPPIDPKSVVRPREMLAVARIIQPPPTILVPLGR